MPLTRTEQPKLVDGPEMIRMAEVEHQDEEPLVIELDSVEDNIRALTVFDEMLREAKFDTEETERMIEETRDRVGADIFKSKHIELPETLELELEKAAHDKEFPFQAEAAELLGEEIPASAQQKRMPWDPEYDEFVEDEREASSKRIAKQKAQLGTQTTPMPIYLNQKGEELAEGEYLPLSNFENIAIASRATKLLEKKLGYDSEAASIAGKVRDTDVYSIDIKGAEAQFVRTALEQLATGEIVEKSWSEEEATAERRSAKRILDTLVQGPKQIEMVHIDPSEDVITKAKPESKQPRIAKALPRKLMNRILGPSKSKNSPKTKPRVSSHPVTQ